MTGLFSRKRMRAAGGLIVAYALALQTLFAAFAPLPTNAAGVDFAQLSVICFGGGESGGGPGGSEAPASGKLHCVPCCWSTACAATLPSMAAVAHPAQSAAPIDRAAQNDIAIASVPARSGPARAPPPVA